MDIEEKKKIWRFRNAQLLRAFVALPEKPGSVCIAHPRCFTIPPSSSSRGSRVSGLCGHLYPCVVARHKHTHRLIIKNKIRLKKKKAVDVMEHTFNPSTPKAETDL